MTVDEVVDVYVCVCVWGRGGGGDNCFPFRKFQKQNKSISIFSLPGMTMSTSGKLSVEKWARNKKLKDKCIGTVRVQFSKVATKQ